MPSPQRRTRNQQSNGSPGRSTRSGLSQSRPSHRSSQRSRSRRQLPRLPSVVLHGTLHIEIGGAEHLLNLNRGNATSDGGRDSDDGSIVTAGTGNTNSSALKPASCLASLVPYKCGGPSVCNPCVEIRIGNRTIASTTTLQNTLKPAWYYMTSLNMAHSVDTLTFRVVDKRPSGHEHFLGELRFAATGEYTFICE
jgi:hypothetical protein